MKSQETLNTKCADIHLIFPMNICAPCSDKWINNYDNCKAEPGGTLVAIWKQNSISEHGRGLVRAQNHNDNLKERGCFTIISVQVACRNQNEER
jgi:hypothetical protein